MRVRVFDAAMVVVSSAVALALCELATRVLVSRPLPPLRIVDPAGFVETDRAAESLTPAVVVGGKRITSGDLWGYHRHDSTLVYTVQENKVSVNRWWQSNNIGARSRTDTGAEIPKGKKRYLVFGESFGAGTRLPQEEVWSSLLDASHPGLELVNLAVDGYSMAQAYLRFLAFKDRVAYDGALMMFAPDADLWRDINTVRNLVFPWGEIVKPRYVLEDGKLTLVPSPYADPQEVFQDNRDGLGDRLRDHLRRYDRFYFPSLYESPPLVGDLWIYKVAALAYGNRAKQALLRDMALPGSEAARVTREIFLSMQRQSAERGVQFALLMLPPDWTLRKFHSDPGSVAANQALTDDICVGLTHCIDLAPALREVPEREIDAGYDGTHYGPVMSRRIAEAISAECTRRGLF